MTQYLPPNLLALFAPRDPLPYIAPLDKLPWEKKLPPYTGVAQCINEFEDPKDTPPPTRVETKEERKERKRKERAEQVAYKLEQDLALWVPGSDPGSTTDPFKTLFVARINYDTSESKLRREFEAYGPVRKVKLVMNQKTGKPRGFGFIEYEHERDMHSAYKHADGKKLDGRRVLVDVERGRTIKGWRCRRLGGGLGGTRKGGPEVNTKYSGREENMREDRSRSRSPMRRRRRSRSRSPKRPRRSRSRERRRRSKDKEDDSARKRSRRSRSPRERKRSRSRDRKRSRRSRSPRERKPRTKDLDRERKPTAADLAAAAEGMGLGAGPAGMGLGAGPAGAGGVGLLGAPAPEGSRDDGEEAPEGNYMVMDAAKIKPEPRKKGYDKYENTEHDDEYGGGNGYSGQDYNNEQEQQQQQQGDDQEYMES